MTLDNKEYENLILILTLIKFQTLNLTYNQIFN